MAYRFKLNERAGKALLRTGAEQFDRALASLDAEDQKSGVHDTRKSIKRLRALLRLARPGLDRSAYQHLNETLRDAGRTLSATRDRDVLLATVADISAGSPELRPTLRRVSSTIAPPGETQSSTRRSATNRKAHDLLSTAAEEWQKLEITEDAFGTIAAGLQRGMRDLAKAYEATEGGDEEAFHDLRKAVQRHWRHMRLVEAGWPAYFVARADEAKAISELLGKAQDLTLLIRHLHQEEASSGQATDAADVLDALKHQRAALQEAARSRTQRLLAEGPRALARRATEYWTAAIALRKAKRPASTKPAPEKTTAEKAAAGTGRSPLTGTTPRRRSAASKPPPGKRPAKTPPARVKPG